MKVHPKTLNLCRRVLLAGGILASFIYAAMNAVIPLGWAGYDITSQTISELSALDAPTRSAWDAAAVLYAVLMTAFGCGIWASSGDGDRLRITGALISLYSLLGLFWPPMHQREVLAAGGATLTDTLHLVWSAGTVLFMVTAMIYSATAIGSWFRAYSVFTIALMAFFGTLTGLDADRVRLNLPTPLLGIWERLMIGAFLVWTVVLALVLLKRGGTHYSLTFSRKPSATSLLG